jgi:hypothetical protein
MLHEALWNYISLKIGQWTIPNDFKNSPRGIESIEGYGRTSWNAQEFKRTYKLLETIH